MYQSLKPVLISLKVLGFCSLKCSSYKTRYGYWYYLWSILLLVLSWLNVLREGFPLTWTLYHVLMMLISSFMMASVLWNEKKLVGILENIERLDLKIGSLNRSNGRVIMALAGWLTYVAFKIYEGLSLGIPSDILFAGLTVSLPNIMVVLLSISLYEELRLRYSALVQQLSTYAAMNPSQDLCLSLQSARVFYFSLRAQVCLMNNYLGFPLLCAIFNEQIHIFTKFLSVLDTYYRVNLQLVPHEFLLIFHLSSAADNLEHQVRK